MKFSLRLLPVLLAMGCHKNNPSPLDRLPPATQTGQYTFGCLLNGQSWTPLGFDGSSNYSVVYDPTYKLGTLNIAAYRYTDSNSNSNQTIGIFSDSMKSVGRYKLRAGGVPRCCGGHQGRVSVLFESTTHLLSGHVGRHPPGYSSGHRFGHVRVHPGQSGLRHDEGDQRALRLQAVGRRATRLWVHDNGPKINVARSPKGAFN